MHRPLTLVLILLAACAGPQAKVEVQVNPAADFTTYRSYGFVEPLVIEDSDWPPAYAAAFRTEIARQLQGRGMQRSDSPDLLINVAARSGSNTQFEKDSAAAIHPQRGTFYDGWRGYGHGYGAYGTSSGYVNGTFDVGLVDVGSNELVWEGVATRRLSINLDDDSLQRLVAELVEQLFAQYPVPPTY